MGNCKEKSSDASFSSSVSHEMCRSIKNGGGGAREDISTRIESIPGRNRNRNNTHLEKFLNLDDITNSFIWLLKVSLQGAL